MTEQELSKRAEQLASASLDPNKMRAIFSEFSSAVLRKNTDFTACSELRPMPGQFARTLADLITAEDNVRFWRKLALVTFVSIALLLGLILYNGLVIAQQQTLIRQMSTNPACMVGREGGRAR